MLGTYALAPFLLCLATFHVKKHRDNQAKARELAARFSTGRFFGFSAAFLLAVLALPVLVFYCKRLVNSSNVAGAAVATSNGSSDPKSGSTSSSGSATGSSFTGTIFQKIMGTSEGESSKKDQTNALDSTSNPPEGRLEMSANEPLPPYELNDAKAARPD